MKTDKNNLSKPREGGDDALSHPDDKQTSGNSPAEDVSYTNEERIAEDGERNLPEDNDKPSGSGIASKE